MKKRWADFLEKLSIAFLVTGVLNYPPKGQALTECQSFVRLFTYLIMAVIVLVISLRMSQPEQVMPSEKGVA